MFDTIFSRKFKLILSNKDMNKNVKHQKRHIRLQSKSQFISKVGDDYHTFHMYHFSCDFANITSLKFVL